MNGEFDYNKIFEIIYKLKNSDLKNVFVEWLFDENIELKDLDVFNKLKHFVLDHIKTLKVAKVKDNNMFSTIPAWVFNEKQFIENENQNNITESYKYHDYFKVVLLLCVCGIMNIAKLHLPNSRKNEIDIKEHYIINSRNIKDLCNTNYPNIIDGPERYRESSNYINAESDEKILKEKYECVDNIKYVTIDSFIEKEFFVNINIIRNIMHSKEIVTL